MVTKNTFLMGKLAQPSEARTVEVAPQPAIAKVVREGFQVPAVSANTVELERYLGTLEVVQPRQTPRVVSQSIKPGTRVTAGTVVDLVLAPISDVPFDIFEGVHRDLRQRKVTEVLDGVLAQPAARQTVQKYAKAEDVPQAEREALTAQFVQADIGVDEASSETNFAAAFNAARVALAFK